MSKMTEFMNQMKQVNEPGIGVKEAIQEAKGGALNGKSMSSHIMAYKEMMGLNETTNNDVSGKAIINEDVKMKMIGALNVMKELLSEDLMANPQDTMEKVKHILKDF